MTGKKFDFYKTVKVGVMKVYTVWMQVMSVKNDLDLASILHTSLLCDKLSLLYQNSSLVTLEINVTVWLNSSLFPIILHFTFTSFLLILRRWLVKWTIVDFCFASAYKTAFFTGCWHTTVYFLKRSNLFMPFHRGQFRISFQSNALQCFSCHFPCSETVI